MKTSQRKRHSMVVAKVNAPVDEGIAALVTALSEFPEFLTVDSCQGGDGLPAYVYLKYSGQFIYRGTHDDGLRAFSHLAKAMAAKHRVESLYEFHWVWDSDSDFPVGCIKCAPEDVPRVAKLVHSVADDHRATGLPKKRVRPRSTGKT